MRLKKEVSMSLRARQESVKFQFDPKFKATARGGACLIAKAATKLGLTSQIAEEFPKEREQTLILQTVAGMSLGAHGQSAPDVIANDTQLATILGIDKPVGSKRTHAVYLQIAGGETRTEEERNRTHNAVRAFRKEDKIIRDKEKAEKRKSRKKASKKTNTKQKDLFGAGEQTGFDHDKGIAETVVMPNAESKSGQIDVLTDLCQKDNWGKEAQNKIKRLIIGNLKNILDHSKRGRWMRGNLYNIFLDGTLLESNAIVNPMNAIDRNGNMSMLFLGMWLGPLLIAYRLVPGNVEEGSLACEVIEDGLAVLKLLGIQPGEALLMADSAYGQGHILKYITDVGLKYVIGMNRHRKPLTKRMKKLPKSLWKVTKSPSRGYRDEHFYSFNHSTKNWNNRYTVIAVWYRKKDEVTWDYSFITTNLEHDELSEFTLLFGGDSPASTIWRLYSQKQADENFQKNLLSDIHMHTTSSSRACINQLLFALAILALNINVFISYCLMPQPFECARIETLIKQIYTIAGRVSRHSGYIIVTLATSVSHDIQKAFATAMEALDRW